MPAQKTLLEQAYQKMFTYYGPLGWWPAKTPFEVMIGAILTQNTAWSNVEKAMRNLKKAKVLNPRKMLALKPSRLSRLIKPAGYFRVKEKRVRAFLKFLIRECHGNVAKLRRQRLSSLRKKLLQVHGIGPETADSILLYALEKPAFVIDAYTKRIFARHHLAKETDSYESFQDLFSRSVPPHVKKYNEYHAQIVNIGKDFCRQKPRCLGCPLNGFNWRSKKTALAD